MLAIALFGLALVSATPGARRPERWTEARAGWLFRSALVPAGDVADLLRAERIDLIVDLTDEHQNEARDAERRAAHELGVRYLHLPVPREREVALASYAGAVHALAEAHARGERVWVHCQVGYRRSAAAIALYARLIEGAPREVAYRELFRYADETSRWQSDYESFLERNLDDLRGRVTRSTPCQACAPTESTSSTTPSEIAATTRSSS
jgi:protein-tyrosine phosphatase